MFYEKRSMFSSIINTIFVLSVHVTKNVKKQFKLKNRNHHPSCVIYEAKVYVLVKSNALVRL